MGLVLAAPGSGAALAAAWGRQLLERERAQGASAVARTTATSPDPLDAALGVLVRAGDASAAAGFLATPDAWVAALARSWSDEGTALSSISSSPAPTRPVARRAAPCCRHWGRGCSRGRPGR